MVTNIEIKVNKRDREDKNGLDRILKRLKTGMIMEGIIDQVRAKRAHETPKKKRERKLRQRLNKEKMLNGR
jgi:ribosomal protein S21